MRKWDEMTPRERDALVLTEVLGWSEIEWRLLKVSACGKGFLGETLYGHSPEGFYGKGPDDHVFTSSSPSTDISAAWEVVEKMQKEWAWSMVMHNETREISVSIGIGSAYSTSAPEAICKAALKAVGVDIE